MKLALIALLGTGSLWGQVVNRPNSFQVGWQITPVAVPTSPTDVLVQTGGIYLDLAILTNTTGAAIPCTIQDKQGSPLAFLSSVSVAANTTFVIAAQGRWFPGGITWSCTGVGVIGYLAGKYAPQ